MKHAAIRKLFPVYLAHKIAFPAVVILGLIQSVLEAAIIGLFIPLLHNLTAGAEQAGTGKWLLNDLNSIFLRIPPGRRLTVIALILFSVIIAAAIVSYARGVLFSWLDGTVSHQLRSSIFRQLLRVGFGFIERDRPGRLLNVLASDSWRAGEALRIVVQLITTSITLLTYILLLLLMSWQLTLLVAVAMLLISQVVRLFTRGIRELGEKAIRFNTEMGHRMVEGIDGMPIIRAFSRERYEEKRFDAVSDRLRRAFLQMGMLEGAVHPVHEVLVAGLLLIVVFATARTPNDVSVLLVFLFVLYRLQPRVKEVQSCRVRLDALSPSVQEVLSIIDTSDKQYVESGMLPHPGLVAGIRFDHVSFLYDRAGEPALSDVSFFVPAEQTTALVGPSGGGKSTAIKLIMRFHDPARGTVFADEKPLHCFDLESWRNQIALVSQDCYLFNATVRENIAYGRLNADLDEIVDAARQADAHGFIECLPEGYDTVLGHNSVRLSGGQRQRISLARAIVRNPRILILDEATNALDSISEHWIQETLNKLRAGRTVIMIAHRLATIERADRIVVLEKGRVMEIGTLPELIRAGGLFARLSALQRLEYLPTTVQME